jgi:hypothetical protein
MLGHSEECRAYALRCFDVAEKAPTPEDRLEFISLARSWQRLADEIERDDLLIALINELTTKSLTKEDSQRELQTRTEVKRWIDRVLNRVLWVEQSRAASSLELNETRRSGRLGVGHQPSWHCGLRATTLVQSKRAAERGYSFNGLTSTGWGCVGIN